MEKQTSFNVQSIGIIHSQYYTKDEAPIQGVFRPEGTGWVELFPEYEEGLEDIEMFTHVFLIYYFDRAGQVELIRSTFLDDMPHGVFATRHPSRPSGIGFTVVELLLRESNKLKVSGIDVLDNTPLLDIKPYIPRFDCFPNASEGWIAEKKDRPKPSGRE